MQDVEDKKATETDGEEKGVEFVCPKCGSISRDDVVFLCNTCTRDEVVYKDGMYICPSCLNPGENFECMICESKEVKMVKN
uniref:DUF1610 domain-containing protein n=1 Tax=candidate division WWE3 bacterium TaxID=2053526 RepID=A0A7C4XI22_UNCKA